MVFLAWRFAPVPLGKPGDWVNEVLGFVRQVPFPLFVLLLALLPMVGIPVTALYVIAGAIYAPVLGYPLTLAGMAVSILLNASLSYAVAQWFHTPVEKLLQRWGRTFPKFTGLSAWKVILLVRLTPGAPLMVQNLFLGLARVPFAWFLGLSLVTELAIATGYLTVGGSFATGRWGGLAMGAGIVVVALLLASLVRERMRMKARSS